jgi:DNA-directed RNA polymerase subunit M/transcription elongation factor TFIIS
LNPGIDRYLYEPPRTQMIRTQTREKVALILKEYQPWLQVPESLLEYAASVIESSCNNANVDRAREKNIPTYWEEEAFMEQYSNIIYAVLINLDPNSSVNKEHAPHNQQDLLIHRVLISALLSSLPLSAASINLLATMSGTDLHKIGYMSSIEFNPHINQHILDEIEHRSIQEVNVKTTEMYLCEQCGKRVTKYWKAQTRSGDEGYTIFVVCQICGHEWRIY